MFYLKFTSKLGTQIQGKRLWLTFGLLKTINISIILRKVTKLDFPEKLPFSELIYVYL